MECVCVKWGGNTAAPRVPSSELAKNWKNVNVASSSYRKWRLFWDLINDPHPPFNHLFSQQKQQFDTQTLIKSILIPIQSKKGIEFWRSFVLENGGRSKLPVRIQIEKL